MRVEKILFAVALSLLVLTGCKTEAKKSDETKTQVEGATVKTEKVALKVSGMSCAIGCAKTIESKLAKKEGVIKAQVIFKDSIANIEYDPQITNKQNLIEFIGGVADGKTYKACESKQECTKGKGQKTACKCKGACGKACASAKTANAKGSCASNCTKPCCTTAKAEKKACSPGCEKPCCKKA